MGASLVYLEEPDKTKHSDDAESSNLAYGQCSMQGWRLNQVINFIFRKTLILQILVLIQMHRYSLSSMGMGVRNLSNL